MKRWKLSGLVGMVAAGMVLMLFTQACNLPGADAGDLTPTSLFILPEETQVVARIAASSTPEPTMVPTDEPTAVKLATVTPTIVPALLSTTGTAISFLPGGTTAYELGQVSSTKDVVYVVSASAGQTMRIGVSSSGMDVFPGITAVESGQVLLATSQQKFDWTGVLPVTGDYLISLHTNSASEDYFLSVDIPANILFDEGKDAITIDGYIAVHAGLSPDVITHVGYLAYASAGQTMTVNITSPNIESLSLGIYGQSDGQPYKRYEVKGASGTVELPVTQGYYINVYSTGGVSTDFSMEVTIR